MVRGRVKEAKINERGFVPCDSLLGVSSRAWQLGFSTPRPPPPPGPGDTGDHLQVRAESVLAALREPRVILGLRP